MKAKVSTEQKPAQPVSPWAASGLWLVRRATRARTDPTRPTELTEPRRDPVRGRPLLRQRRPPRSGLRAPQPASSFAP